MAEIRIRDCSVEIPGDGVLRGGKEPTFTATVEITDMDPNRVQLTPSVGDATLDTVTFQDEIDGEGTYDLETTQSWINSDWNALDWSGVDADGTQTVDARIEVSAQQLNPPRTERDDRSCGDVEVYNDAQEAVDLSIEDFEYPSEVRDGDRISWSVTFRNDGTETVDGEVDFQIYGTTVSTDSVTFPAGETVTASGRGRVDDGGLGPGDRLAVKVSVSGPDVDYSNRTDLDTVTIAEPPSDPEPPEPSDVLIDECTVRDGDLTDAEVEAVVNINNTAFERATVEVRWFIPSEDVEIAAESVDIEADESVVTAAPVDLSGLSPGEYDVEYEYDVSF